ncbi:MAG TPA: hypothetical protein DFS52_27950, partial [Myxococcales bacterium]|nr:hypothetical protein [Myxococcales bacterium]
MIWLASAGCRMLEARNLDHESTSRTPASARWLAAASLKGAAQVKGNLIVALVVGALLGFVLGRATKTAPGQPAVAQVAPQAKPAAKADAPKPAPRGTEDPNAVYKIPVANSPSTGPATAKVTVVEVTDFQCPYCSRANTTMKQVKETYGDDVRIVVKQNPLSFHQHAHLAAQAALAAHEQGKYWEMHHKLFENTKALERPSLEKYAQELGLDLGRFKAALDSQKHKDQIDAEQRMAVSLGAGGTPSFFINGRKVVGAQPLERFKQVIDEELKKADALLAKGIAATFINSTLSERERQARSTAMASGAFKLVYLAPERFRSPRFFAVLRRTPVSLFAVDEAHCIS